MLINLTATVFLLMGLALAGGGAWLLTLGGSVFYILAGMIMVATAVLLLRRSRLALVLHGLLIVIALAWAISEVGFDWWQLGPRGGLLILLGLWLLLPPIQRRLGPRDIRSESASSVPAWLLGMPVLASVLVALYAMTQDPKDIGGVLPKTAAVNAAFGGTVPDGEWHQYGRTPFGQRFSPLTDITPANVS